MMSTAVSVDRVHGLYRLRPPGRERERLDRALRDALDAPLERALEDIGIGSDELLCVRRVHVPLRLHAALTDSALRAAWSDGIARAIRDARDRGEAVRYGSMTHALFDIVSGVALGRVERAWAWRQLELWPAGDPSGPVELAGAAVDALLCDPASIVPVLVEVARTPALFATLASALTDAEWATLARAALVAAGAATGALDDDSSPERPPRTPLAQAEYGVEAPRLTRASESPRARLAAEVARRSHVAMAAAPIPLRPLARRALAVVATLEVDGARLALGGPGPAELVRAVATLIHGRAAPDAIAARASTRGAPPPPAATLEETVARDPGQDPAREARPGAAVSAAADGTARRRTRDDATVAPPPAGRARLDEDATRPPGARGSGGAADGSGALEAPARDEDDLPYPEVVRREGVTGHAGLAFLLGLAAELELGALLANDRRLSGRSLRWTLHLLGLRLAPVDAADPAALAFCGLRPGDAPPSEGSDDPTEDESAAVDEAVGVLTEALRERLRWEGASSEALRFVIDRPGRVVCDPGWIEVHLPFSAVSIELRRAGLDRNPDFIPWLGVVLRFVYE